ncbi:MAG TPA: glycosyltransferase family 39 protein, partial [Methanomicrobiales archaeon]|nr:glycosyltransferase family 39 protein [Methanomicrobiales archaeon]
MGREGAGKGYGKRSGKREEPGKRPDKEQRERTKSESILSDLKGNLHLQLLVILILAGGALRFYHLDFNSIWLDEAATLNFARQSLLGIWQSTAQGEFNPPLFNWMEHFMLVFGQSELVLRFIPALLGVLTIPVFYGIGKEFMDRDVGIIAAALLAFSPFHLFYSQDARAYAAVLFFFSVSFLFFLIAMRTHEARSWALFGVFSALAFWTHFYVFIPVGLLIGYALLQGLWHYREHPQHLHYTAASVMAFVLLSLPLMLV